MYVNTCGNEYELNLFEIEGYLINFVKVLRELLNNENIQ